MRPPFFFFNADTDCPHYLLGWVREPGEETKAAIAFADEAGRDINAVARVFNSGCGTAQQLDLTLHRLAQVVERFWQVRKLGYPYAV